MRYLLIGMILSWYCLPLSSRCQEGTTTSFTDKIAAFPSGFFRKVNDQAASLDQRLTRQTEKYLQRLAKKEAQLRRKMFQQDSGTAKRFFDNSPLDYTALLHKLQSAGSQAPNVQGMSGTTYLPYLDSVKTSLK